MKLGCLSTALGILCLVVLAEGQDNTTDVDVDMGGADDGANNGTATNGDMDSGCFSSIDDLSATMRADQEGGREFMDRTYIMCPETTIILGRELYDNFTCCKDGDDWLQPISNSLVMCGEDGKSSNNCVFSGGDTHIFVSGFGTQTQNVELRGITFEQAAISSVQIGAEASITLTDCIFRDNSGPQVVSMIGKRPEPAARRKLLQTKDLSSLRHTEEGANIETVADLIENLDVLKQKLLTTIDDTDAFPKEENRLLQGDDDAENPHAVIDIRDCIFVQNSALQQINSNREDALIEARYSGNVLNIEDTVFYQNDFDNNVPNAHAMVLVRDGAVLSLKRNCFIDNIIAGFGVVEAFNSTIITTEGNFGTTQEATTCEFIAASDTIPLVTAGAEELMQIIQCSGYEATTCSILDAPESQTDEPVTLPPTPAGTDGGGDSNSGTARQQQLLRGASVAVLLFAFWM